MKKMILAIFIIATINCLGQNNYSKGYFIDNKSLITNCFIKNSDWLRNPSSFKYKLTEDGAIQEGNIENVKEFSIPDCFKYKRADVSIDVSPSGLKNLTNDKNPIWEKRQLFLKVLVEGKATLYSYLGKDIDERFFYTSKDTVIKQLICKEYAFDIDHTAQNDTFRLQLKNDVRCSFASDVAVANLPYTKNELKKYFIDYNSCIDPTYKVPEKKRSKGTLSIAPTIGIAYTSFSISNDKRTYVNTDFDNKLINTFSFEIEYILPFNNNKWGIVLSPAYQSYHSKKLNDSKSIMIDFQSIDLAFGLKHYFFLDDKTKLYVDLYLNSLFNHSIDSRIGYKVSTTKDYSYLEMNGVYKNNFIIGAGFEYRNIFAELRYFTPQNLVSQYGSWNSRYEKVSLNIGYKIQRKRH